MRWIHTAVLEHWRACNLDVINHAFALAVHASHNRVESSSGRPRLAHLLAVAWTIAILGFDPETVAAALLHDLPKDERTSADDLTGLGPRVSELVNAISLPRTAPIPNERRTQHILFRQVEDLVLRDGLATLPAIFISLAERLDYIRFSASHLAYDRRMHVCRQTMENYAPLAERLGVWELKCLLEDYAFRLFRPDEFATMAQRLESLQPMIKSFAHELLPALRLALQQAKIPARVEGRVGHVYSTWEKMKRKGRAFADIHDLMGGRIIVETREQCYATLSVVHHLWTPILSELDDYIARPKPNGYRSIHTSVCFEPDIYCDIQIRTEQMHQIAEYGLLAHWRYKGNADLGDQKLNARFSILQRQVESIRRIRDLGAHLRAWHQAPWREQIHVYCSTGQLISLPPNTTPIDLAFAISPRLAPKYSGAQVNGMPVSPRQHLKTGDSVTVLLVR